MRRITPILRSVAVTTAGVYITTRGNSNPQLSLPKEAQVLAWSLSTAPSDASGGIYVSEYASGVTSNTDLATMRTAGLAVQLDVGEALVSPPNMPGPFELSFAVAAVSGIAQVRLTLWIES